MRVQFLVRTDDDRRQRGRRLPLTERILESALASLVGHYAQRQHAVHDVWASGRKPLPYLGADVPRELIEAAGFVPLRLYGDPAQSLERERILGSGVDPMVRSLLAATLERARGRCRGVVIAHDGEGALRLFHALRALARQAPQEPPDRALPEAHFFDLLHLPRSSTERYNLRRMRQLVAVLERWSGRCLDEAALRRAVDDENQKRALLLRLQALRRGKATPLSGPEALAVIGACSLLPAAECIPRLERALAELERKPARRGCRVFVTGSDWDHPALYSALEAQGAVVVGEDHEFGDLAIHAPLEPSAAAGDLLSALASHYHRAPPTGRRVTDQSRAERTLQEAVAARAERVVCVLRQGDPAPEWDVAEQRQRSHEAGLAFAVVAAQPYARPCAASLRAALEAA